MINSTPRQRMRGNIRFALTTVLVLGLVIAGIWLGFLKPGGDDGSDLALTPPLTRGPLRISVMESGNLESLQSHKIVNRVEGRTAIDYVIPEGTILTEEDVRKGTVLVRLNTADIEDKRVRQEIEVSAAADSHANAVTNLEIQIQENASDLRKADLDVRFARLDLERFVGKPYAAQLLSAYQGTGAANGGEGFEHAGLDARLLKRLISSLLESETLEGEALQRIRQLLTDIQLADEEHRRAAEKLKHSERLEEKGYISREELELDKLALERRVIEKDRTRTARDQFVEYDFPKEVAKLISGVVEARDRRSRAEKKAESAESQKRSAMVSREKQWKLKMARFEGLAEQKNGCTVRATVPGLVVYASSGSGHWRGNDDRIHEGASVRQGQALITIPDPKSLGVLIKVHESAIDRVREGLEASVEVDAVPGSRFPARVTEVNRMPDPADRWLNPDLKVYTTKLQLLQEVETLKPGMSAQVEVHVTTLQDVLAVPTQVVTGSADHPAVFVWENGEAVRREVELGLASEHFVEVKSGVSVGDRLLLDPPRDERRARGENGDERADDAGGNPKAKPSADRAPKKPATGRGDARPAAGGDARPAAGGDAGPRKRGRSGGKERPARGAGKGGGAGQ